MMIKSFTVRQSLSFKPVSEELKYWLDSIQNNWKGKIINVTETKVSKMPNCSDQGFIILYEENEENEGNTMNKQPTNGEIITRFQNNYEVNASDYRPLEYGLHDIKYGMEQRPGITVYCENGDIILYFPNCNDYPKGGS